MSATRRTKRKGVSLSRVPASALGTFLVVAGLYFLYMEHGFPRLSQFPNGTAHVNGKAFFGVFGLNGWSGELTVAAGALLLFGAAQHHLAKTASFVVAVVFAGVGIWALADHHSALGLFAANIWTILLWFAAAAYLLINTALPRPGGSADDGMARRIEPIPGATTHATPADESTDTTGTTGATTHATPADESTDTTGTTGATTDITTPVDQSTDTTGTTRATTDSTDSTDSTGTAETIDSASERPATQV